MFAVACTFAFSKVVPRRGCSFHTPARCTIAEVPWVPISTDSRTVRSPGVTRHRSRTSGSILPSDPVRTRRRGRNPCPISARQTYPPRRPVPPVTKTSLYCMKALYMTVRHRDDDFSVLLVGFHVAVGLDDAFERAEDPVDDRPERPRLQPVEDIFLRPLHALRHRHDLEQGVPPEAQSFLQRRVQRKHGGLHAQEAVYEDGGLPRGGGGKGLHGTPGDRVEDQVGPAAPRDLHHPRREVLLAGDDHVIGPGLSQRPCFFRFPGGGDGDAPGGADDLYGGEAD